MSVLAQKIKGASFQPEAFPRLKALIDRLGEAAAAGLEGSCAQDEPAVGASGERAGAADGGPTQDGEVVYDFATADGRDQASLVFTAPFVKALSEASLGGAFVLAEVVSAPSVLEQQLGEPFASEMMGAAARALAETGGAKEPARFQISQIKADPKAIARLLQGRSLFKIDIRLDADGGEAAAIMSFLFPMEFLERQGLTKPGVEQSAAKVDAIWRAKMTRQIHASEIDVEVVMDRYMTAVSTLADLEIGQVIPLEGDAHNALSLYLHTRDGPVRLGKGRLGTYKKKKAVKLTTDLTPPLPSE